MRHPILPGLLFYAMLAPRAASQIDAAMLERVRPEVLAAVKKETGADLAKIRIRLAKRPELAWAFEKDRDSSSAEKDSPSLLTRTIWRNALAKFSWSAGEILLCPRNFKRQARLLSAPELDSEAAFRAVLVHECIHAVDEQRHGWSRSFGAIRDPKRKAAYNAVIEGHAQLLAAKICEAHGWKDGFEAFTSVITKMPPDIDEASRLTTQVAFANLDAAYNDGMKFMGFIVDKLGEKGVARVFERPPADFEDVLHPEWYLDPKLRPARLYDLEKPLMSFAEVYSREVWLSRHLSLSGPRMQAALALLPKKDVDRILGHMKHNQVIVLGDRKKPGSRSVTAALMEFDSPEEALFYVFATDRLNRLKDAKMAKGRIRITGSDYVDLEKESWRGLYMRKTVMVGFRRIQVSALVAAKGSVAVELVYNNEEAERGKLAELAAELLEQSSVAKEARKSAGKER